VNGLKQRIIGALVLVSLAVIFVPIMFDEPHSERETSTIQIPEEPPFPEVEMPEPETTEPPEYRIEELNNTTEEAAAADVPTEAPAPPEAVVATESSGDLGSVDTSESAQTSENSQSTDNEPISAEFSRSLEGAWVVQLGSFGSDGNATRLREKVRAKGYSSHLQRISRGDSELTRVFSGPFAEKAEAEKAKLVLDKAFGLNSLVTSGGK
jgi:DedD protein